VTLSDIEAANQLASEALGRTLDELPPQTRLMLKTLYKNISEICEQGELKQSDYRFSRKSLRENLGWTYDQVRVHLDRLIKMEHVLVHRGGRGQSFDYELLYDGKGQQGEPFLNGLIDVKKIKAIKKTSKNNTVTKSLGGEKGEFGVSLGGHWGAVGVGLGSGSKPESERDEPPINGKVVEDALIGEKNNPQSCRNSSSYSQTAAAE